MNISFSTAELTGLTPAISKNGDAAESQRRGLPTIGFVAGGPYQSNSPTQAQRSAAQIAAVRLAAPPGFILSQGGFVFFFVFLKHSRSFIVGMLMPYVGEIDGGKKRKKNHSFCYSLAWTPLKCKIEFMPIHVLHSKCLHYAQHSQAEKTHY